jgi:thiamine pyrophosphate-dependent acetolactate synthase large subunit-like protein
MEQTGGELIQDFLGAFEVPYVFGNPGTTETTFLAAVAASKASYVLALHESSAVGIAAGYAMGTTIETTHFVGMDFNDPDVDVQKIAAGLGARTQKIDSLGAIGDALTQALAYSGPSFLVIDREP